MSEQHFDTRDAKNASLHRAVSMIERELGRLPASSTPEGDVTIAELRASWTALVKLLALEPVREVRECPNCRHVGMRAATRCSNCWTQLSPVATERVEDTRDVPMFVLGVD
jgi:hypothetical protein